MQIEKLYEMQKVLDARIIAEKKLEGQDLLSNTILALQVEIAELANEWRGFKHWSNDREPRTKVQFRHEWNRDIYYKNPLLEEYVDCLHFFLSIARQLEVSELPAFHPRLIEETITEQIIDLILMVGNIRYWDDDMTPHEKLEMAFLSFIDLGHGLGLTWEQVSEAYIEKNKTNHERQANGY